MPRQENRPLVSILNNIFGGISHPIDDIRMLYTEEDLGSIDKHTMDAVIKALN